MFAGIIISAIPMVFPELLAWLFPDFAPDIRILYFFPIILIGSLVGCIVATYLTKPTDYDVLKKFYKNVRPWGFWKPIDDLVVAEDPSFIKNSNFKTDSFNIIIGILWQTSLVALPMYFIFHEFTAGVITLAIAITLTFILKKTWYDKLHEHDE
jgi:hypothetical protein